MKIDAHHHFWEYDPVEYDWIDESMAAIRHDYGPPELKAELDRTGIDGVVSVQARQSLEETHWLLSLAEQHAFLKGVVGWLPLADPDCEIPDHEKLKGVRHVVQGEPDGFMSGRAFNQGVARLREHRLVYDVLIVERQLPEAIRFVDNHPDQVFVLDHIAKPKIRDNEVSPWREQIELMAERPHVSCKISGFVTEADFNTWTPNALKPYFDVVLDAFGPERLMFGSDWPVCLVACPYERWHTQVSEWCAELSDAERNHIMGETAQKVYGL